MNILVTGGAGFIGSHLSEVLLNLNHRVVVIDNLNDYYNPEIKKKNIEKASKHVNYKFYKEDIRNLEVIFKICKSNPIDLICHLAARAGVRSSIQQPELYQDVNIKGTLNILEICKNLSISKLLFASSSSIYGNNTKVPFSESDPVDNPISPYAATKKACELLCYTYCHLYNINISCLRFFTVYGPRQRPDMAISKFTNLIYNNKPVPMFGDGSMERDFTYIDDIIDGILKVIDNINGYEIYNLGKSQCIKLIDLINLIGRTLNKEIKINRKPLQPGDVNKTYSDITKAKNKLGYNPKTNIEIGIQKYIEWYLRQNA